MEGKPRFRDPEKVSFLLNRLCPFNRGNKNEDYANIFPGPNFVSPEWRCPLNRGSPRGEVPLKMVFSTDLGYLDSWIVFYFLMKNVTASNRIWRSTYSKLPKICTSNKHLIPYCNNFVIEKWKIKEKEKKSKKKWKTIEKKIKCSLHG